MKREAATVAGILGIVSGTLSAVVDGPIDVERLAGFDPEKEVAIVDTQSVRSFATVTVFTVRIAPQRNVKNPTAGRREIRYLVSCSARKLALAAVSLIDASGQVAEVHNISPGEMQYRVPEEGSSEQRWLGAACGAL